MDINNRETHVSVGGETHEAFHSETNNNDRYVQDREMPGRSEFKEVPSVESVESHLPVVLERFTTLTLSHNQLVAALTLRHEQKIERMNAEISTMRYQGTLLT
jgi:hypothetical protein